MKNEEENIEICAENVIHGDVVRAAVAAQPEMCVCDITACLGATQSAVSHQLRILKQSRLIKSRRDGKIVYYALADDHVKTIFAMGMEHITE